MSALPVASVLGALLGTLACAGSAAQTPVYRCGEDGRAYSSSPCAGGHAIVVDDPRSAEQRRQANEAARAERGLADRLEAERRRRDATVEHRVAARLDAAPAAAKPASKPSAKTKKDRKKRPRASDPALAPLRAGSGA